MTKSFLLDTSALLAHCLEEPGSDTVENILEQYVGKVGISAMTWLEFQIRLEEICSDSRARQEILTCYSELLEAPIAIDKNVVKVAMEIRSQASQRIPNADAIIAATAKIQNSTLVHRDPHLSTIPTRLVEQLVLPAKAKAPSPKKKN